jgi:hypothetical protein
MKIQKPKIGSKVLCIAECIEWQEMTAFPPKIGWVYLVNYIQKMNAEDEQDAATNPTDICDDKELSQSAFCRRVTP